MASQLKMAAQNASRTPQLKNQKSRVGGLESSASNKIKIQDQVNFKKKASPPRKSQLQQLINNLEQSPEPIQKLMSFSTQEKYNLYQ